MNKLTNEQIKEFWEWCGLMKEGSFWHEPSGKQLSEETPKPNLENLFKWPVPKLQEKGYQIDIVCFEGGKFEVTVLGVTAATEIISDIRSNDLVDALFWAIWEVIKDGK